MELRINRIRINRSWPVVQIWTVIPWFKCCLEQRSMPKMGTVTIWEKELNRIRVQVPAVETYSTQECIPVGCVPSEASAVSVGGGVLPGGGVCFPGGCASRGCASWGCLPGVCVVRGVPPWLGDGGIPACSEADPPPAVDRHTPVENKTFETSLRTVIILCSHRVWNPSSSGNKP